MQFPGLPVFLLTSLLFFFFFKLNLRMMSWGEIIPSYGNELNHPFFLNTTWYMIHPQSHGSGHACADVPARPVFSQTGSDDGHTCDSLSACSPLLRLHLFVCVCFCLFSPVCVCVGLSFLFILPLCWRDDLFFQRHFFLILHVACWASSRCQLPAEWCIPLYLRSVAVITR